MTQRRAGGTSGEELLAKLRDRVRVRHVGRTAHDWLAHFDLPDGVAYWLGSTLMAAQGVSDHYAKGNYEGLPPDLESFDDLGRSLEGLGLALGQGGWAKNATDGTEAAR